MHRVCKSWYSLITCPSFASSHLILSSPNQEPRLLVRYYENHRNRNCYRVHRDNQTFDEIAELYPPIARFTHRNWELIDSLNGLVCLDDMSERSTIVLWNPSIRKSIILPKPRALSGSYGSRGSTVGFGFIPSSNKYKVVWHSISYGRKPQAEIYQLSTGSWRDLELGDFSYITTLSCNRHQAHYNGIIHWYASCWEKGNATLSYFICSFDTKDEKFGALMLPSCLRPDHSESFDTYIFRESLCLIDYSAEKFYKIWVMKEYGVADSWEKLFIIDGQQYGLESFLYFRYNGELLYRKFSETPFDGDGVVSYDYNNSQVKDLKLPPVSPRSTVHTYVDSLVLIKAPNDAKIDEESTKILKNV